MVTSADDEADTLTLGAALREGRRVLARTSTETPGLDAEVLLRHALRIDRTRLFANLREQIEPRALSTFHRLISARAEGSPVAYLTGQREFMGLTFIVEPDVLIPRPETEILVEWAVQWIRPRDLATVLDVGAGSGAIALTMASMMGPNWSGKIIATDVSPAALRIAEINRHRLGLRDRVEMRQGSLLAGIDEPVELLLANLPYLRPEQIAGNPELSAEPRLALDGGDDGLDVIRELLKDAPRVLVPRGAVGLEIDPAQRTAVIEIARLTFPTSEITILKDLAGLDRHIIVETKE